MLQPPFLLRRAASNARRINGPAFSGMPDFFRGDAGRTSVEPEQLSADAFPIVGPGTARDQGARGSRTASISVSFSSASMRAGGPATLVAHRS